MYVGLCFCVCILMINTDPIIRVMATIRKQLEQISVSVTCTSNVARYY